jgi:hypothetical protein
MKTACLFLILASAVASAQSSSYVNFIRQMPQGTSVVWDMPVAANGNAPSGLLLESGGSLFQLWTIDQTKGVDYLLDQKLVGAYLPKADVTITSLDPFPDFVRTRIDQPFTVDIQVFDLLTGTGLPEAATKVLLERHLASYKNGVSELDPAAATSGTPFSSAYLTQNGKTSLKFPASSLTSSDPTKATGEEHFVVHALSDGTYTQTQLDSAKIVVYPVASGAILGLKAGEKYRYQLPTVQLNLADLYPRSDTSLMLYEGNSVNGSPGVKVLEYPWTDTKRTQTTIIMTDQLTHKITKDGTYTVALVSNTVYGNELLADPITFSVQRTLEVNAMQVDFTAPSN